MTFIKQQQPMLSLFIIQTVISNHRRLSVTPNVTGTLSSAFHGGTQWFVISYKYSNWMQTRFFHGNRFCPVNHLLEADSFESYYISCLTNQLLDTNYAIFYWKLSEDRFCPANLLFETTYRFCSVNNLFEINYILCSVNNLFESNYRYCLVTHLFDTNYTIFYWKLSVDIFVLPITYSKLTINFVLPITYLKLAIYCVPSITYLKVTIDSVSSITYSTLIIQSFIGN
jgi:hypothetical protein